jgi:hypothetical protein
LSFGKELQSPHGDAELNLVGNHEARAVAIFTAFA